MYLKLYNSREKITKSIELEELVANITSESLKGSFGIEAVKAFSIMVRTELARKLNVYGGTGCPKHKGCDLCDEQDHCIMFDISEENTNNAYKQAANSTKGIILTFDGKPIKPYFHYRCGGATENSKTY